MVQCSTLYEYIITKINLSQNNEGTKEYVTKKEERLLICHEDLYACSWNAPEKYWMRMARVYPTTERQENL